MSFFTSKIYKDTVKKEEKSSNSLTLFSKFLSKNFYLMFQIEGSATKFKAHAF